jgi:hypothetical protein
MHGHLGLVYGGPGFNTVRRQCMLNECISSSNKENVK